MTIAEAQLELARREAAKRGLDAEPAQDVGISLDRALRHLNVGGAATDTALAVGSSAVATPVAGLEAVATGVDVKPKDERSFNPLNPLSFITGGFSFDNDKAKEALDSRLSKMTIQPKTELGERALGFAGDKAGQLDLAVDDAALGLADGDPTTATFAKALPLVALEAAGIKGASNVSRLRPRGDSLLRAVPNEVPAPKGIPSTQSLLSEGSRLFDDARRFGSELSQESVTKFRNSITSLKEKNGLPININKKLHPESHAVLKEINRVTEQGASFDDMLQLRQIAGDAAGSVNPKDARIAAKIRDSIDDYFDGLKSSDMVGGNPERAVTAFKEANATWRRAKEAEFFERLIEKANNDVASNYSQAGLETAIKRRVKNELNSDTRSRRFSPEAKAAMQKLVDGDNVGNFMRFVGRAAPRGIISGILAPAAATSMFGPAGIAIAGVGEIAKRLSASRTINQADDLVNIAKSGGLLGN